MAVSDKVIHMYSTMLAISSTRLQIHPRRLAWMEL